MGRIDVTLTRHIDGSHQYHLPPVWGHLGRSELDGLSQAPRHGFRQTMARLWVPGISKRPCGRGVLGGRAALIGGHAAVIGGHAAVTGGR